MLIPTAMVELDEAHAAFGQTPGQQTIARIAAGLARLRAVHLKDGIGLLREIDELRHGGLHAVGHLVLRDSSLDLGVALRLQLDRIQLADGIQHGPAILFGDAFGIGEEQDGIGRGAELHALIVGRQETAAPEAREQRLVCVQRVGLADHDDERRQILVLAAEPIAHPRTHARAPGLLAAALKNTAGSWLMASVHVLMT